MKISRKWREKAPLYKRFAENDVRLDWSDAAMEEMFRYESVGGEKPSKLNGYYHGKLAMDRTISMWREGLREGTLLPWELYSEYGKEFIEKNISKEDLEAGAANTIMPWFDVTERRRVL